jgi:hypothetical protein
MNARIAMNAPRRRSQTGQAAARRSGLLLLVALAAACGLQGCGSTIGSMPLIGTPANSPAAPEVTPEYPAVGVRPEPSLKAMTPQERAKLEAELVAARTQAAQEKRDQINRSSGQPY